MFFILPVDSIFESDSLKPPCGNRDCLIISLFASLKNILAGESDGFGGGDCVADGVVVVVAVDGVLGLRLF